MKLEVENSSKRNQLSWKLLKRAQVKKKGGGGEEQRLLRRHLGGREYRIEEGKVFGFPGQRYYFVTFSPYLVQGHIHRRCTIT